MPDLHMTSELGDRTKNRRKRISFEHMTKTLDNEHGSMLSIPLDPLFMADIYRPSYADIALS